jgi:hypothetical protein
MVADETEKVAVHLEESRVIGFAETGRARP